MLYFRLKATKSPYYLYMIPKEAQLTGTTTTQMPHVEAMGQVPVQTYTQEQLRAQELLLRDHKRNAPGEGAKRLGLGVAMFTAGTVYDIAESHAADWLIRKPLEVVLEKAEHRANTMTISSYKKELAASGKKVPANQIPKTFIAEKHAAHTNINVIRGEKLAADFIEEWVSDEAAASVVNAWVRLMTGDKNAKYVSETAAFLSDWGNVISQVFLNDVLIGKTVVEKHRVRKGSGFKFEKKTAPARGVLGIKLAYQSMDLINPVNVEAALRVAEEVPVLGSVVSWAHDKADHLLDKRTTRIANTVAAKGVTGYHIGRNVMK